MSTRIQVSALLFAMLASEIHAHAHDKSGDNSCTPTTNMDPELDTNLHLLQTSVLVQGKSPAVADEVAPGIGTRAPTNVFTEHSSGVMEGWMLRFPQLQVGAQGDMSLAARSVPAWTGLGDNWWMEFVDGRAHAQGPHAFDTPGREGSDPGLITGENTFHNMEKQYRWASREFANQTAWASRWNADKLAALNAVHREMKCKTPTCSDMFDTTGTYVGGYWLQRAPRGAPCSAEKSYCSAENKSALLVQIMAEYYDAVDSIPVQAADLAEKGGNRSRIQHALPFIAKLYYQLANLHPFRDANSRVRNMVLQTELVRQGGHPLVLWDNYWSIKYVQSSEQAQEFILDGWCSWERAYNTQVSPFLPFVRNATGALVSTAYADYNAQTGACERGPPRAWWVPAGTDYLSIKGVRAKAAAAEAQDLKQLVN